MATIRTHRDSNNKPVSYTVVWRVGGGRYAPWDRERFTGKQLPEARKFKGAVEAHGHTRPPVERQRDLGLPIRGALTVTQLVTDYIDDRAKHVKSDRTIADYRRDLKLHLAPAFGTRAADDLDPDDVQEWVDGLERSPKTVGNLHSLLAAAYKWENRKGRTRRVSTNPCVGTELPTIRKMARGLRKGEWTLLYQAACDVHPDVADLLLFLVGTGWRWSEATALQVHEVDGDLVSVGGVWRRNAAGQQVLVKDDAKSEAGLRTVRLSPRVSEMVTRHCTGKKQGDFVFTTSTGKAWRHSNFYSRYWARPAVEAEGDRPADPGGVLARAKVLGLHVVPTIHWLRHTQVKMLIEAGASLPTIQRRIGHESITTTIGTYGLMVDDVPTTVLTSLDEQLFGRQHLRAVGN